MIPTLFLTLLILLLRLLFSSRWNEGTLGKHPDEYCAFIMDSTKWGGQVRG
jgi:hypothetical protein